MMTFKIFLEKVYEPKTWPPEEDDLAVDETYPHWRTLKIQDAYHLFFKWMYDGVFNPTPKDLDNYEQAFWLVNSVLPKEVLDTYKNLKPMYRGFKMDNDQIQQAKTSGINIGSRIMSWAPRSIADEYLRGVSGVMLEHTPKPKEVVVYMNKATIDFLKIDPEMIVNHGEAILSIPKLRIEPADIVYSRK